MHTDATSDTLLLVTDNLTIDFLQSTYGTTLTHIYTLETGNTTVLIILRLGHTDDTIVVHTNLGTVIGAACESNLYVSVIREDHVINLQSQALRIIVTERTERRARTCNDISGS